MAILEAAYRLDGTDDAWLAEVARTAAGELDGGFGVMAWFYDASAPEAGLKVSGLYAGEQTRTFAEVTKAGHEALAPEDVRRLYLDTPACVLVSELYGVAGDMAASEDFRRILAPWGLRDSLGVNAREPDGRGVLLTTGYTQLARLSSAERRKWARVAAHVAAGLRVRRGLRAAGIAERDLLAGAEAVLDGRGRVAHAEGPAVPARAREALRRAAVAIERARGRMRRTAPDEAVDLWAALVSGRWSLLDFFDHDGRRFIVARQNEPAAPGTRPLTTRERQVSAYAAMGHSNKLIAYELGLSTSTVATTLGRALRKLGLRRRTDLPAVVAAWRAGAAVSRSRDS